MSDPKDWATIWPGPLPIQVMMQVQWDQAFEFLFLLTSADKDALVDGWLARTKASDDREVTRRMINDLIDRLFERKRVELGLAWSFLAADASRPETIQAFVPQVAALFAKAVEDEVYTGERFEIVRETLNVWMAAAGGEYVDAKVSVFAIAAKIIRRNVGNAAFEKLRAKFIDKLVEDGLRDDSPGLIVMPKNRSAKLPADNVIFKEIVGKRLPFVVAGDVFQVQAQLRREYPHAWPAIDLLTRDLREGEPVRIKPVILVGDPGSGKSRLARRLAEWLGYVTTYRFDASGISDAVAFSGTARGWGNTTPSVPARAVQQLGHANPWILIDELDKAGTGAHNGNLYGSITPFLERESSKRYRDINHNWIPRLCCGGRTFARAITKARPSMISGGTSPCSSTAGAIGSPISGLLDSGLDHFRSRLGVTPVSAWRGPSDNQFHIRLTVRLTPLAWSSTPRSLIAVTAAMISFRPMSDTLRPAKRSSSAVFNLPL